MKYRIKGTSEGYQVQSRGLLWWRNCVARGGCSPVWRDVCFDTLPEAKTWLASLIECMDKEKKLRSLGVVYETEDSGKDPK